MLQLLYPHLPSKPVAMRPAGQCQARHRAAARALLQVPMVKDLRSSKVPGSSASYADVLIAYEVFNEAEGISWDARLYHNYM
jgi:hypothetical protein